MHAIKDFTSLVRTRKYSDAALVYNKILVENPKLRLSLRADIYLARNQLYGAETQVEVCQEKKNYPVCGVVFFVPSGLRSENGYSAIEYAQQLTRRGTECLIVGTDEKGATYTAIFPWLIGNPLIDVITSEQLFASKAYWLALGSRYSRILHVFSDGNDLDERLKALVEGDGLPLVVQVGDELQRKVGWTSSSTMVGGVGPSESSGERVGLTLGKVVDERLFYPRPRNLSWRRRLDIHDDVCVVFWSVPDRKTLEKTSRGLLSILHDLNTQGVKSTLVTYLEEGSGSFSLVKDSAEHKVLESVERMDLPDLFAAADIFLVPAMQANANLVLMPLRLKEYFAIGRVILVPRSFCSPSIEHKRHAYLYQDEDKLALIHAITEIRSSSELAERLRTESVALYRNVLAEDVSPGLLSFYKSVLANRSRRNSDLRG